MPGLMERFAIKAAQAVGWPNLGWAPPTGYSGAGSITGINMTTDAALGIVAVFAAVRVLSEDVASLPLHIYRTLPGGGKERAVDHPTYAVLHDSPNPEMTAMVWRETMVGHLLTWGNCYSEKVFNGTGQVVQLWPLRVDRMDPRRADTGRREYRYTLPNGELVVLPPEKVFHVPAFGFDGLVGYSPIAKARRALEVAMAAEEFGGRFFANDARPGVVLSHPRTLSPKARENLEKSWSANHQGLTNAQRSAVLEEGITVTEIGVPPEDAQFLETRRFGIEEVARLYRLAPHKIGELSRATYSNIEEQNIDHVTSAIRGWCVRIEQQAKLDLFPGLPGYFAEHLLEGLLRGKTLERYQAYAIARQWGWLNADEIRDRENMNPEPDGAGADYLAPLNMAPAGALPPNGTPPARQDMGPMPPAPTAPTNGRTPAGAAR